MRPISFVICNYNATEFFRFCYESVRKNLSAGHEIVLLDDGSVDGSARKWMRSLNDPNVVLVENPENIGIAYSYNSAVDVASNEVVCVLHSDMYVPPGFDEAMLRGMQEHDFICAYRAEPKLYPPTPDKGVADFGHDLESFDESGFLAWNAEHAQANQGASAPCMFFPWMTSRETYLGLGGVDLLFLKYMVDDDDLYLRAKLSGARMAQVRDTAVYHFGSRSTLNTGGRFTGTVCRSWEAQYARSQRNFVRKWGRHSSAFWSDAMEIVPQRLYDIGIIAAGATLEQLRLFEPWASNVYIDSAALRKEYLALESENTLFNLAERVRLLHRGEPANGVLLEVDCSVPDVADRLESIPALLDRSPSPDIYELESGLRMTVRELHTLEQSRIVNTRKFAYAKGVAERDFRRATA